MKILVFSIVYFLLAISFSGFVADFYPEAQALKMVKIALKEKEVTLVGKIDINDSLGKEDPIVLYRFSRKKGADFYVAFTQATGRYEKFDYLIMVNLKFTIEKIRVLKYRSEHGGEIASKRWLQQFENYATGELRYKKEISALSGATISASSIVADIPKVLKILKNSCK